MRDRSGSDEDSPAGVENRVPWVITDVQVLSGHRLDVRPERRLPSDAYDWFGSIAHGRRFELRPLGCSFPTSLVEIRQ